METCKGCKYYDVKQLPDWESKYCDYYHTRVVNAVGCCNYKEDEQCQKIESTT